MFGYNIILTVQAPPLDTLKSLSKPLILKEYTQGGSNRQIFLIHYATKSKEEIGKLEMECVKVGLQEHHLVLRKKASTFDASECIKKIDLCSVSYWLSSEK